MRRQISYRWLLRDVMADHDMFATTALVPLLHAREIDLSPSQVHRLVTQTPERLSLPVLAALCDIFECTPSDLLQTSAHTVAERKAAGGALHRPDPGPVGLDTLLREVDKLNAVTGLDLPAGLFADASEKLLDAWRARATRSYPSDLAAAPREVRLTLLAALCHRRQTEITDALVDLLICLVHKINTRVERRVDRELTADMRRVRGKKGILFRLAEAAVEHPEDTVREALHPVVAEKTLRELGRPGGLARGRGRRARQD